MQQFDYQGKKVACYISGNSGGAPLVLLHGFCEDSRVWDGWLELMPGLPAVRIDLPGFGNSDLSEKITIENMAAAVKAVLDEMRVEKFVLTGHSLGGYVSLAFAENWPDRLAGFCLFHSHPFADSEEKKAARLKSIEFVRQNGHVPFVRQLIPGLFAPEFSKNNPGVINRLVENAMSYSAEAITGALEAMRIRQDRSDVLHKMTCPVLFIIGKQDSAVPFETSLAMSHLPAHADIRVLERVGHMGMFEAEEETAAAMLDFYQESFT